MRRKLIGFAVVMAMLMSFVPCVAQAYDGIKYGDYLYYKVNDDGAGVTITDCDSNASGEIVIPDEIDNLPVTSIGNYAFEWCTRLTSITIPNSVTSIGSSAFQMCEGLTSIDIPDSVTSIGWYAFRWCTGLTSITIPNSVTSIGMGAFYCCTGLTSINIPNSVTRIGREAFYNTGYYNDNTNWTDNVLYIGNYLVDAKDDIRGDYSIQSGTKLICDDAFYGSTGLTSVIIPDSVTYIGDLALSNCTGLTSIGIPDSVTSISCC